MSTKHPIDELFKQELKEHKIEPSAAVWEKVAASQMASGQTKKGLFILRAASVALLVGISALFYFNRNQMDLQVSHPQSIENAIVAGPETTPAAKKDQPTNEPSSTGTELPSEPAKANSPKPNPKAKAKKQTARVIPVLQQTIADPILALNDLQSVDYELSSESAEEIDNPNVLRIRLQIPELKGNYAKPESTKADLGQKMWAYASNQYERVRAGESLELPNTDDAKIEIPLPDFINRRFNK